LPRNQKILHIDDHLSNEEMHPPAKANSNATILSS